MLLPDVLAIAVWLLPVAGVLGAVALLGLWLRQQGLASLLNGLVFVIWISLWLKRLTSALRLAPHRRADTAQHGYGLYLS